MITTFIIYFVLVVPVIFKVYNRDKGEYTKVKIINFLVTFLIFSFFVDSLRENILWLKNNLFSSFNLLYVKVGIVGPVLNIVGYFIYIISSLLISVIMIGLAIRNKQAHRKLLYLIPFVWFSQVVYLNFKYFENLQSEYTSSIELKFIVFTSIILAVIWGIIICIFYNKNFKSFFKEISTKDK